MEFTAPTQMRWSLIGVVLLHHECWFYLPMLNTKCPHCKEYFVNPRPLERHLLGTWSVVRECIVCYNNRGDTYGWDTINKGLCKGRPITPPTSGDWACMVDGCDRMFLTNRGLGQHIRHEHLVLASQRRSEVPEREATRKRFHSMTQRSPN